MTQLKLAADNEAGPKSAREALAKAIERHKAALAAVAANETAYNDVQRQTWRLRSELERANEAIEQAKKDLASHLVNKALGKDEAAPISPKEARLAAQAAQDELDAALTALAGLRANADSVKQEQEFALYALRERISDFCKTDPMVERLIEKFRKAHEETVVLEAVIGALPSLPDHARGWRSVAEEWLNRANIEIARLRASLKELDSNADANLQLPKL